MKRLFSRPTPRIGRGEVVVSRAGLGIVVKRRGETSIVVLTYKARPSHRADIHPSSYGSARAKMKRGAIVRCIPIAMKTKHLRSLHVKAAETLMHRIDAAVAKEITARKNEDALRPRSRPSRHQISSIYSWGS